MHANPHPHPNPNPNPNQVIVEIASRRYDELPMVLQGPGAGLKITAAGLFADLLRLSRSLVSFNVPTKSEAE